MQLERFAWDLKILILSTCLWWIFWEISEASLPRLRQRKGIKEGIGFDASNYGYAKVSNSDMVAIPDMSTAFFEIRGDHRMLHVLCDVVSTEREKFDQYPRNIVKMTKEFLNKRV